MRTTVNLDEDIVASLTQLREERGLGLSEVLNRLARSGSELLHDSVAEEQFVQRTHGLGLRLDVTNVAEAFDALAE
ncbi:MAG: ribbon-helix-helix protein, CopG family [Nocardioidaceae bacterium]|nr:ribbon-helix-helix protein, CopG family [Nocardioidaceae bacterium]